MVVAPASAVLVLQHCPVTPVGILGETLARRGAALDIRMPHHGEALPPNPAGFDGLVVLGGPMHAGDDAGYPAFPPMLDLIRQFHDQAKPVLGVCLGAQLVSRAFGGHVWPFGGLEIGYLPVRLTPARRRGAADVQRRLRQSGPPGRPDDLWLPVSLRSNEGRCRELPPRLLVLHG